MLTEAIILLALRDCYDPEIACNVVDLGVIQEVDIERDESAPGTGIAGVPTKYRVRVALTPTNPTEDTEAQLAAQVANRLAGMETVSRTTVTFVAEPHWTPQRITPAGRRLLGLDGNPALVQIR